MGIFDSFKKNGPEESSKEKPQNPLKEQSAALCFHDKDRVA